MNSTRTFALLALAALNVLTTCCAATTTGPSAAIPGVPDWTKQQCAVKDGMMYAVGSSDWQDPWSRTTMAIMYARAELAKCRQGTVERTVTSDGTTTTTETRESVTMSTSDMEIVDSYIDPETGFEYALAAMPAPRK